VKAYLSAALFAAAVATPALAQNTAPAAPSFTGPRIEAHVGYDNVRIGSDLGHADGVTFGAGAGYDFALGGSVIAGVEVNGDFSTADKFGIDAKRDLDASVRIGTSLGTSGLIYAKVGYANARFGASGVGSGNADGVRGAIGYEMMFGHGVYGKAEYRYTNYEAGISRNQGIVGVGYRF